MIPQQIILKGFLSYQGEQKITFGYDAVWMLAGPNGSGKSTTFDAVTYALFGGHRAGKDNAHELINKASDKAEVLFDFQLDGKVYRAHRTLRRTTRDGRPGANGTQQLYQLVDAEWQALPDTHLKREYDDWIRRNVGLTFETFTSSILLMQGKADLLLAGDAAPRRFEVLAHIVQLDRYRKLHEKAHARQRTLEAQVEVLQHQIAALPDVGPDDLAAADAAVAAAEGLAAASRDEVDRLRQREVQAAQWQIHQQQLAGVQRAWQQAKQILEREAEIERAWVDLAELRVVLPQVAVIVAQRDLAEAAARRAAETAQQRQALQGKLEQLDAALGQARQKLARLDAERQAAEEERQGLADHWHALSLALGPLRRLHQQRGQLATARARVQKAADQQRKGAAAVQKQEAELAAAQTRQRDATARKEEANLAVARAATLLAEAGKRRQRFASVADGPACSYCGQALTADHLAAERQRLDREHAEAEAAHRAALAALRDATAEATRQETEVQEADRALAQFRKQLTDWEKHAEVAEGNAQTAADACAGAYADLAEPYRGRVAPAVPEDWLTTSYPGDPELAELQEDEARVKVQLDGLGKAAAARQQHWQREQQSERRLAQEREAQQQALADLDRQAQQDQARHDQGQEKRFAALAALPPVWKSRAEAATRADLQKWLAEQQRLEAQGVEGHYQQLQQARTDLAGWERQLRELEAQAAAIPEAARCDVEQVREALRRAQQAEKGNAKLLAKAQGDAENLKRQFQQRRQLDDERKQADRQRQLYTRLARLLGKQHLQLHLVRRAERGIVDFANAALDRLSGGQLFLQRCEGEEGAAEKALQLEVVKAGVGTPFGLAFLSGSERFRVAVSLALGIGQYASRQHRPIESVIIDEGFGCLDRENRQTMIQELHNLRGQLRCILLVSHQEEFADAFTDGWHFRLEDGATRATRFQR